MASTTLSDKMYLLDGSFMSGIKPFVNIDSVINHPLWGSNLLLSNEEAVVNGHKSYIRGNCIINVMKKRLNHNFNLF